jgi:hypothetical protein
MCLQKNEILSDNNDNEYLKELEELNVVMSLIIINK